MNRLQSELRRLYLPHPAGEASVDTPACSLIDGDGRVRAMVLELGRPANWELLSAVWRGVQAELALPAPAIAVSGTDGFQLWFSLAQPVSVAQAHAFVALLRSHFLPELAPGRTRLMPVADALAAQCALHAAWVPAQQAHTGQWSAFVAPDLAPIFTDTPWLDIPPGNDGQADLLCRLESIEPPAFEAALERLTPALLTPALLPPALLPPATSQPDAAGPKAVPGQTGSLDAKRFLLRVMNDDSVALALRIEAAKALLPYTDEPLAGQDG